MANEQTESKKKPPAHEVIIEMLRQLANEWTEDRAGGLHPDMQAAALERATRRAEALTLVLMRMHIPENARPWVVDALQHLPPNFLPPMVVDLYAEIEGDKGGA